MEVSIIFNVILLLIIFYCLLIINKQKEKNRDDIISRDMVLEQQGMDVFFYEHKYELIRISKLADPDDTKTIFGVLIDNHIIQNG